jgi:hypothetical protein
MSTNQPLVARPSDYWESLDRPGGRRSRPSKNNRPDDADPGENREYENRGDGEPVEPTELPGDTALRPLSVEERTLRDEAVMEVADSVKARPWYAVLNEWRGWYSDYLDSHIEYESEDGETVRAELENSYMPGYGDRYYARLKGLEREIGRRFDGVTTVMLTDTASTLTVNGNPRPPADHMRDIADGWDAQRKALHRALEGHRWEYCRIWEPHPGGENGAEGYGHLHIGVFVEDPDNEVEAELFEPVMESYYENCDPAGWDAHKPENGVSVSHELDNMASYLSEYIGVYGDDPLDRPMHQQMFYATTWATNTRRVEFSNGAQELIKADRFRQETGLRPEDRGGGCMDEWASEGSEGGGESAWSVDSIAVCSSSGPEYHDPTTGGVDCSVIDGVSNADPPPKL